jgi:hypothetical protein
VVAVVEGVEGALAHAEQTPRLAPARRQDAGREHWLQEQGGGDGHQQAEGHGEGLVPEEGAGDARHVDHGEEDGHRGQGRGHHGPRHLAPAQLGVRAAHLQVARDVLEHDDGVVHQHAGRQREAAQAHQVELHLAEVEQGEGDEDGYGDGRADHERAAHVAQEEEEHEEGQDGADDQGLD